MFTISLVTWILLLLSTAGKSQDVSVEGKCKWNNSDGMCILVEACPQALAFLQINDMKSLKTMFCGFEGIQGKVCCPIISNADLITFNRTENIRPTEVPSTTAATPNTSSTLPTISIPIVTTTKTSNIPAASPIQHNSKKEYNDIAKPQPEDLEIATTLSTITELNYKNEVDPPPKPINILPDRTICGLFTVWDKIFGGNIAAVDEFPWVVRLKHRRESKEFYGCAGSLINDRYVLTAAHCVVDQNIVEIRLGEWDADSEKDCYDGICSDPPVDVKVEKIISHSDYNRRLLQQDIALIRMERSVNFTDFIRPVCLPNTDYVARQDYVPEDDYTVVGWGKTEFGAVSPIKRKLRIKAVSMSTCKLAIPSITDDKARYTICAGGRRGQDSCSGDSGGPLIKQVMENYSSNWFLFGITSFGARNCGMEGKPGIYTRITSYMDWILQNITP